MQFNLAQIFNPGNRALIGVDIGGSSIKMVELASNGKGQSLRMERYCVEPLPRDAAVDGTIVQAEVVSEALLRAWKRLGSTTKNVALALPVNAVISKKVILPSNLSEKELNGQVLSEANQYIPFPMEEVNLDYTILGPSDSGEELDVLITAAKKDRIIDRLSCLEAIGLKASVMDVENFAMQRALMALGLKSEEVVAHIDIGASIMKITMYQNGISLYSREQNFGGFQLTQDIARDYGMSLEDAEEAKKTGQLPSNYESDLLQPFVNTMSLEVSRALQFFFTSTQYGKCDRIVLSGGCVMLPEIVEVVADRAQVSVELANPFKSMTLSDHVSARNLIQDASCLMVACGLALRRFD
ncbi:MAG TPA: pilus assembly protein PilM [Ignavibacteriaceae bacterium]